MSYDDDHPIRITKFGQLRCDYYATFRISNHTNCMINFGVICMTPQAVRLAFRGKVVDTFNYADYLFFGKSLHRIDILLILYDKLEIKHHTKHYTPKCNLNLALLIE